MIISASRRTDIPAFYAPWLRHRLRAGYCTVPNPFNPKQVTRVSLRPEDVDAIVFWTRNPRPLMGYLPELEERGYRYYFLFTLLGYPRVIDPKSPPIAAAVRTFQELADRLGPARVIWRYDPIVVTSQTSPDFHRDQYQRLAQSLRGYTLRSVVSLVHLYRKVEQRLGQLGREHPRESESLAPLLRDLAELAKANDMEMVSCASAVDWQPCGIRPGKCVDDKLLADVFGLAVSAAKDPCQRQACGCVVSKDIGMYDSCLFGCRYCYATKSFERAKVNFAQHDQRSPSLLGWHEVEERRAAESTTS